MSIEGLKNGRQPGMYDVDHRSRVERETALLADAGIASKMNAHQTNMFREKFPNQVEQILRLTAERLQGGLHKDSAVPLSHEDVKNLAIALQSIHDIYVINCARERI